MSCVRYNSNSNYSSQNEDLKLLDIALNFTKYLLQNQLITFSISVNRESLVSMYADWKVNNRSTIEKERIISILNEASLLKNNRITKIKSYDVVQFKEYIFHEFSKLPKIRVSMNEDLLYYVNPKNVFPINYFCEISQNADEGYYKHTESIEHDLRRHYFQKKKIFLRSFPNLNIKINDDALKFDINEEKNLCITLENISSESLIIKNVYKIYNVEHSEIDTKLFPLKLSKGIKYNIGIKILFTTYGLKMFPLIFDIYKIGDKNNSFLLLELLFHILKKEFIDLGPISSYQPRLKTQPASNLFTIRGEHLEINRSSLETGFLKPYLIPKILQRIFDYKGDGKNAVLPQDIILFTSKLRRLLCDSRGHNICKNSEGLNKSNYTERFHFLLWLEEYHLNKEIHEYDQCGVILTKNDQHHYTLYELKLKGLSDMRPSVIKGSKVIIKKKHERFNYEGIVQYVEKESIYLSLHRSFKYLKNEKVDVEFTQNRLSFRMFHRALNQISSRRLDSFMFPALYNLKPNVKVKLRKPFFNKLIESNEEQKEAVKNILENRAYPSPYILYGPPGTGKTATLVEAITQIWNLKNKKKICVIASSNSAADLITERLLKYIPPVEILRIYAFSRSDHDVPEKFRLCSNYDRIANNIFLPSEYQILSKSIIVITPVMAGRLVSAGFDGFCFNYIFIDEAGHAIEPEMLVPIIGLLTTKKRRKKLTKVVRGNLILAGDPKQLGPLIRSKLATTIGLDISLLERLMFQCKLYEKNPSTNKYNSMVITKLVNNYRSHEEILRIPNTLFYENELKVKGLSEKINSVCDWNKLPNKNFPLIFHCVRGKEERESNSPSFFNIFEIQEIKMYLDSLFNSELEISQSDIGIITPYRKQVHKIRQYLTSINMVDITVASVEEFQGQERKVIIISTVRSRPEYLEQDYKFGLGFLKNARRFNVAITRAIALLIVVGNPDILQYDSNWEALIQHCKDNNSYVDPENNNYISNIITPSVTKHNPKNDITDGNLDLRFYRFK